jgi:hypothetical protein
MCSNMASAYPYASPGTIIIRWLPARVEGSTNCVRPGRLGLRLLPGPEEIALGLDQAGWQPSAAVAIEVGQRYHKPRRWDAQLDGGACYNPQVMLLRCDTLHGEGLVYLLTPLTLEG